MSKLDWIDAEELAAHVCGLDTEDYDSDSVEQALFDKFDISFEQFHKLAEQLIKFTPIQKSARTERKYQGFVNGDWFIAKVDV